MICLPSGKLFLCDFPVQNICLGLFRKNPCTVQVSPEEHVDNDSKNREYDRHQNPGDSNRRISAFQKHHCHTQYRIQKENKQQNWGNDVTKD